VPARQRFPDKEAVSPDRGVFYDRGLSFASSGNDSLFSGMTICEVIIIEETMSINNTVSEADQKKWWKLGEK
jgi:hypothetical protein